MRKVGMGALVFLVFVTGATSAGADVPQLVRDIYPGPTASTPKGMTAAGGVVFFQARDPSNGLEVWKSDGTPNGTLLVKDISTGDSTPDLFVASGSSVFFRATDTQQRLWKSDGTSGGTVPLSTTTPTARTSMAIVGSALLYAGSDGELWKSDGVTTTLVKDIDPTGSSSPDQFAVVGTTLFFSATDGTNGRELWKSDGTDVGTTMVKDIEPGAGGSDPAELVAAGTTIYFRASTGAGLELWKSDGTDAGTMQVADINAGPGSSTPTSLVAAGARVLFAANDGVHGVEPWVSDGSAAGTKLIADLNTQGDSAPTGFTEVNGLVLFAAFTPATGTELFISDGSDARMVMDLYAGNPSSDPKELAGLGGWLYFSATDSSGQKKPWRSDGTAQGTSVLERPDAGAPLDPTGFAAAGGTVFFGARDTANGNELWAAPLPDGGGVHLDDGGAGPSGFDGGRYGDPVGDPIGVDPAGGGNGGTASSCACDLAALPGSTPLAFLLPAAALALYRRRRR
jgi:ELWxxDGT repeat protein